MELPAITESQREEPSWEKISWEELKGTAYDANKARIEAVKSLGLGNAMGEKDTAIDDLFDLLTDPKTANLKNQLEEKVKSKPGLGLRLIKLVTSESFKTVAGLISSAAIVELASAYGLIDFSSAAQANTEEGLMGFVQQADDETWARWMLGVVSNADKEDQNETNAVLAINFFIQYIAATRAKAEDESRLKVFARIINRSLVMPSTLNATMKNMGWFQAAMLESGPKMAMQFATNTFNHYTGRDQRTEEPKTTVEAMQQLKEDVMSHPLTTGITAAGKSWIEEQFDNHMAQREATSFKPTVLVGWARSAVRDALIDAGVDFDVNREALMRWEDIPGVLPATQALSLAEDLLSVTWQILETKSVTVVQEVGAIWGSAAVLYLEAKAGFQGGMIATTSDATITVANTVSIVGNLYNLLARFLR